MYQLTNQDDLEDLCSCFEIQIWDRYDYLDSSYNSVMAYDNDLSGFQQMSSCFRQNNVSSVNIYDSRLMSASP